ncbi:hypothetical protein [Butyrivibrio sp. FC2001]|uniref:hypothetical protein n=1 Tax=Butyrivibrio sp. FC2001 TaxID=1280671 RepID=UPI00047DB87A|nr:hypothetical protein [Butyrivibrio sp. FC2001]
MKRIRVFMLVGLMCSALLAGCQKASEQAVESNAAHSVTTDRTGENDESTKAETTSENDDSSTGKSVEDTSEDNADAETPIEEKEENATESEAEALSSDDAPARGKSSLISGLRIFHKDNNYYGESYSRLFIGHNYEHLALSDDTKKAYPELEKAILMVNDLIATDEANSYYAAYRQLMKNGENNNNDYPVEDRDWNILVRRADSDVLSVLVEITTASYEDYNHVRYMAYNIKPDTGEVLKLSDIIEDEDALYEKLARKFLEEMKKDYEALSVGSSEMSEAEMKEKLQQSAHDEQLVWTLEPQGVSFWLNSMNLSPLSMNSQLLFCEDEKGSIFTSDVRDNIPDTWVTQLHPSSNELIDADDDGKPDTIYAMETKEYVPESNYEITTGMLVNYNGTDYEFPSEDDDYDFEFSLVHQKGKSVLLSQYKEYEADIQQLYTIDDSGVKETDLLCGWVCGNPDESFTDFDNYLYVTHIMTDPAYFHIAITSWLLSTTDVVTEYRITEDGKFECLSGRSEIMEGSRYELSLKMPLDDIEVVNAATGEVTKETESLKAGDTLKLMFTDVDNYVDCLTKDNKLVRIRVYMDDDLGKCTKVNGENVSVLEVFDDMFFAG